MELVEDDSSEHQTIEEVEVWVNAGIQLLNLMNTSSSSVRRDLESQSAAAKAPAKAAAKASEKASAKCQAKAYAKAKASTSDGFAISDGFANYLAGYSAGTGYYLAVSRTVVFQCVAQQAFLERVEAGL